MFRHIMRTSVGCALIGFAAVTSVPCTSALGQISVGDSGVGYIDNAIPGNQIRLRSDFVWESNKPNRAESQWAWPPPLGNGPALDESGVNYQRLGTYVELAPSDCFSVFVDVPLMLVDPDINDNTGGFGDMEAGFKWALLHGPDQFLTLQLRTYIPTGDEQRGLGTGHLSVEPALLWYKRLDNCWLLEAQVANWVPIDGTSGRQGNVLRYGLGLSHDSWSLGCMRIRPVVEFVGWTVLDGQATFATSPGLFAVEDVDGDTIVNAKFGVRLGIDDKRDLYVGYGRSLTGDRWYEDIIRIELRHFF